MAVARGLETYGFFVSSVGTAFERTNCEASVLIDPIGVGLVLGADREEVPITDLDRVAGV